MLEEKQRPETDILAEDAPLDTPVVDNEDLPAIIIPEPEPTEPEPTEGETTEPDEPEVAEPEATEATEGEVTPNE